MTGAGEYDFIVVGAGSAGSVLAAKLSDDAHNRVLLIEEGPGDESWFIRMPKGFGKLLTDPTHTSYHPTTHDRGDGTPEIWMRGKMLGGSSGLNGMVWTRGTPQDYDALGAENPGWSWSDVLPYLKKIENHESGNTRLHGKCGPIAVRSHPVKTPLGEAVIAAGQSLGVPRTGDLGDIELDGIGYHQANIDSKGRRVSAARGFLTPAIRRRVNLQIATGTRVDRILFEGRRAVGIACTRNGEKIEYRTKGEVILSAGALASPKLLQLSGVGAGDLLQSLGIPVIHDNPGVGANLREHWLLMLFFQLHSAADSYNREFSGARLVRRVLQYATTGRGMMAYSSSEIGAFVRTRPGLTRPDAQLMYSPYSFTVQNGAVVFDPFPGAQLYGYIMRPDSVGSLRAASPDIAVPATIAPNYLSAESDRVASVAMVRKMRSLMSQPALKHFVVGETQATAAARSDDEILDAFKRMGQSGYHASGTCRMGADPLAVVDSRLRVYGVQGLRVMDCSIYPQIIAGNTNAPTMALAWRAADLILQDRR